MRSVIIAWLLLLGCILGAHTAGALTNEYITNLCTELHTMEDAILADDWLTAQERFDALRNDWRSQEPFWRLLLAHERQTELEANMLRVGAYVYAEDDAQSLAELASLFAGYEHILLLEQITWNNIL